MAYGLTEAGFVIKRLVEIRDEIRTSLWDRLGPHLNLLPTSGLGQIVGAFSTQLSEVWSVVQTIYIATDPDSAEESMLDNLSAIVGVTRQDAHKATGTVTCTGTNGVVITAGSTVEVTAGARFVTDADGTISGGTVDVDVTAEETGELLVGVGDLDQIVTPISGWDSVTNAAEISGGDAVELDPDLRVRREQSLQGGGMNSNGAVRAKVLGVDDVDHCSVVSNRTGSPLYGIPMKSFHTIVWPDTLSAPVQVEVSEAIYVKMPSGIGSFGSETFDVTDSRGYTQEVAFSFATQVDVDVDLAVETDSNFPNDGEDLIKAAIDATMSALGVGEDVNHSELHSAAFDACDGITDIDMTIDDGGGATEDPIVINLYTGEIAVKSAWGAGSSISIS